MSKNYTITLSDAEDKALHIVALSAQDWIDNVVHERCRIAIDEMDDRWMFSTIWYRHWIIAQYCIQGCKNVALMTYVPHRTLTPQKVGFCLLD